MKNKSGYCLLFIIVLIAVALGARRRTLNRLCADNQLLLQKLQTRTSAPASQTTNPVVALNSEERRELMRLRGQIQPLRRDLQEMSNRFVTLTQSAPVTVSPRSGRMSFPKENNKKADIYAENEFMRSDAYRSARSLNVALGEFIKGHHGELPDDLAKVEATAVPLPTAVTQRFELIRSGTLPDEAISYTLVAREKEPQRLIDGKWRRLYLRADGGTVTAEAEAKPNWAAWERAAENHHP